MATNSFKAYLDNTVKRYATRPVNNNSSVVMPNTGGEKHDRTQHQVRRTRRCVSQGSARHKSPPAGGIASPRQTSG